MAVTLQWRKLKDGRRSGFLKTNYKGGRQVYEFLNIYLSKKIKIDKGGKIKEKSLSQEDAMEFNAAEKKRLEHETFFIDSDGTPSSAARKLTLRNYIYKIYEKEKKPKNWRSVVAHLDRYEKGKVQLSKVNHVWISDFLAYLLQNLSHNSAVTLLKVVRAALKKAYNEGTIQNDALKGSKPISFTKETEPRFLTLEEVKKLSETDLPILHQCANFQRYKEFARAFIFSCMTGLRIGDLEAMTRDDIKKDQNGVWVIHKRQHKTQKHPNGGWVTIPLMQPEAVELLFSGKEKILPLKPFGPFPGRYLALNFLRRWAKKAGLSDTKKIVFHSGRHSFAASLIFAGISPTVAAKLTGHDRVSTFEEHYKHLMIESQKEAMSRLHGVRPRFMKSKVAG